VFKTLNLQAGLVGEATLSHSVKLASASAKALAPAISLAATDSSLAPDPDPEIWQEKCIHESNALAEM